jgi:hypothetical protein
MNKKICMENIVAQQSVSGHNVLATTYQLQKVLAKKRIGRQRYVSKQFLFSKKIHHVICLKGK